MAVQLNCSFFSIKRFIQIQFLRFHCSIPMCFFTGEDAAVRNAHLQNRRWRKPEECLWNLWCVIYPGNCFICWVPLFKGPSVSVHSWKIWRRIWPLKLFLIQVLTANVPHIYTWFGFVQVATMRGCRLPVTHSKTCRTGWTFSPNTHTLQLHTHFHTNTSLSATQ